jgi:hypothetical protein
MMRRAWCILLLLFGVFLDTQVSEAVSGIRVDETATRVLFHPDKAETLLAVRSSLPRTVTARVKLELINELNRTVAIVERESVLKPGPNTIAGNLN